MKRFALISTVVSCVALSGCVVHDHGRHRPRAAKVVVPVPKVVVPVPVIVDTTPAKHCPPGQAKKGKC